MEKPMPVGMQESRVDQTGRLILPADFLQTMKLHPEWFIEHVENGVQLHTSPQSGEPVEVDPDGRMLIPPSLCTQFKGRTVQLIWVNGRIKVIPRGSRSGGDRCWDSGALSQRPL